MFIIIHGVKSKWLRPWKIAAVIYYLPMVIFKPRTPIWGLQQGLQSTSQVNEAIAHQEEHWEQGSNFVDVP